MKSTCVILIGAFAIFTFADGLEWFSVTDEEVRPLLECVKPTPRGIQVKRLRQEYSDPGGSRNRYNIDGFEVNLNDEEYEDLLFLLSDFAQARPGGDSRFRTLTSQSKGTKRVRRFCYTEECKEAGIQKSRFDLSGIENSPPLCDGIQCAVRRIFGGRKGNYILYSYKFDGINVSPRQRPNTGEISRDNIYRVNQLKRALPDKFSEGWKTKGFVRRPDQVGSIIADASGSLYPIFDDRSPEEQLATLIHETAHRYALDRTINTGEPIIDSNGEWLEITKWEPTIEANKFQSGQIWARPDGFDAQGDRSVSEYGSLNPAEDFAESFTLYRINPKKLKSRYPRRYAYLRNNVFDGIEYTEDFCKGSRPNPSGRPTTAAPPRGNQ